MNSAVHTETLMASEAVIPIRRTASESAEMVSQLLFGECCVRLEQKESWDRIRTVADGYEGWVDRKMLVDISKDEYKQISGHAYVLAGAVTCSDQSLLPLPLGTGIPLFRDQENGHLSLGKIKWSWDDSLSLTAILDRSHLVEIAYKFLNTPYLWGGCSGYGIDCSGLTQRVFRMCGIDLPRDSSQQAKIGESISFGDHLAGDLAFFSKPQREKITHVGLIIDKNSIIHASGRVRIDGFREEGIWNATTHSFTHQLITIQRC